MILFSQNFKGAKKATPVCTFHCDELDKDYIIFYTSEDDYDENGDLRLYVAYYEPDKAITSLDPVTDPDELRMAQDVIEQIENSQD